MDKLIQKQLRSIDKRFTATVCGSYRRGLPTSGDIDMLVTHPTFTSETSQSESKSGGPGGNLLKTVVEVLETEGLITDTISHGGTKFMGVCQLQKDLPFRRLDIRIVPQDQVIKRDIFTAAQRLDLLCCRFFFFFLLLLQETFAF